MAEWEQVDEEEFFEDYEEYIKILKELKKLEPELRKALKPAFERVRDMPADTFEQRVRRVVEFVKALHEQRREKHG